MNPKPKKSKKSKDTVHVPTAERPPNITIELCVGVEKHAVTRVGKPLTATRMKELLGWEIADKGDALFKDFEGNPIVLKNNSTNRPFKMAYAKRYMSDMLRQCWALNGETFVFDWHGKCQSGQHRGVGLILAEQLRLREPEKWEKYWTSEIQIETVIFTGIDPSPKVVNTIDIGQKRTLGDILFRDSRFPRGLNLRQRTKLANTLAGAARIVWLRTNGNTISDAPHFPHSEAMDFLEVHPKLVEALVHINGCEGDEISTGRNISRFLPMPYATATMYLMAASGTDPDMFEQEGKIDFSLWEQAESFWTVFSEGEDLPGHHPIQMLRQLLRSNERSSAMGRDETLGMIVKCFNLWIDGKVKVKQDDIAMEKVENEHGRIVLDEHPRLGGIDLMEV